MVLTGTGIFYLSLSQQMTNGKRTRRERGTVSVTVSEAPRVRAAREQVVVVVV